MIHRIYHVNFVCIYKINETTCVQSLYMLWDYMFC